MSVEEIVKNLYNSPWHTRPETDCPNCHDVYCVSRRGNKLYCRSCDTFFVKKTKGEKSNG